MIGQFNKQQLKKNEQVVTNEENIDEISDEELAQLNILADIIVAYLL